MSNQDIRGSLNRLGEMGRHAEFSAADLDQMIGETANLQLLLRLAQAKNLFHRNKFEDAARVCGLILGSHEDDPRALEILTRICRARGDLLKRLHELGIPDAKKVARNLLV